MIHKKTMLNYHTTGIPNKYLQPFHKLPTKMITLESLINALTSNNFQIV